jgi:hypothetical protein
MKSERCERCPDEDTSACEECEYHGKDDIEDKLRVILSEEEQKIKE